MNLNIRIVSPGKNGQLFGEKGELLNPPDGWIFLPAGDAGVTRKVTAQGEYWRVQFKKGRKTISTGVWAPALIVAKAKSEVADLRQTESYQKKLLSDRNRRERKQSEYELEFCSEVERFLNFHPKYKVIEKQLAVLVTQHAIPVGSGTVARTQMIPIEERAAKAVIAWLRHQTTSYDRMHIARIKGERRSVRRNLAEQSLALLSQYREGKTLRVDCPLMFVLSAKKES